MRDLTATGSYHRGGDLIGTPLYMAPELFVDASTTAASDVYAIGVLAHVCATGQPLHSGSGIAVIHNIMGGQRQLSPDLDRRLAHFVQATTATEPSQRPATEELPGLLRDDPSVAPAWTAPAAGATVLAPDPAGHTRPATRNPATSSPTASQRHPRCGEPVGPSGPGSGQRWRRLYSSLSASSPHSR